MVDRGGLEPPTSAMRMQRSSQLSYRPLGVNELAKSYFDISERRRVGIGPTDIGPYEQTTIFK